MIALALLFQNIGKYEEAESLYIKALEGRRRALGPQHPDTIIGQLRLAGLRLEQHQYGNAEPLLREALTSYEKSMVDTWRRYDTQSMLGASLTGQKKYAAGEALLLSGHQGMLQRVATIPAFERIELERAGQWIVQLYQDWGKPVQAAEWGKKLQAAKLSGSGVRP
jgi:hypothetical protein